MKRYRTLVLCTCVLTLVFSTSASAAYRYWVATSASIWNNTASWAATSGGASGASVPGSTDTVVFDRGSAKCTLTSATTIVGLGITGYTGTLDMAGFNFTVSGTANTTLATGTILNSSATSVTFTINSGATVAFIGTAIGTSLTNAPIIVCSAADLFLGGGTFYSVNTFTKTGSGLDYMGTGNNTFNAVTTVNNTGSNTLAMGYLHPDIFNADVTFNNSGTGDIEAANKTAGNMFNGNIIVNSTNGGGVTFAAYSGSSATLASGKTITVGSSGFTAGNLSLAHFTQTGTTAQSLTLTGTAALVLGPTSTFNGNVIFKSPRVLLGGATYNGTAYIEKTGATEDYAGSGGNVFNDLTTLVNSGSANFITGYSSADVFNADVTLTNTGTTGLRLGENTSGNAFNGNIIVNSTGGVGITFDNNTPGTSTLASGKTITVGTTGFTAGTLQLNRFTQSGSTSQSLTLTGSSTLATNAASFNAALTVSAPAITMQSSMFYGTVTMTNTTNSANSYGGNTFYGTSLFTNSGTGTWVLANNQGDKFNSDVTFAQTGSGPIRPASSGTSVFTGNIVVNSSTAVTFGSNNGIVDIYGFMPQTITSASSIPVINNLVMFNSSGLTLNNQVTIGVAATLLSGIINTTSANLLNFGAGSSVSGASDGSYVNGPVQKTGNTAFTFPIGDNGYYAPMSISAPTNITDKFTAQYWYGDPNAIAKYTDDKALTIQQVTDLEYWNLSRGGGSSAVSVTLSWNSERSGTINAPAQMTVAHWNGSLWADAGNGGTTGSSSSGTIVTQATQSSFGYFTLATTSTMNTLPVTWGDLTAAWSSNGGHRAALLKWTAISETGNNWFDVERSTADGNNWQSIGQINSLGDNLSGNAYSAWDNSPLTGTALYRIKQISQDGSYTYSKVVSLASTSASSPAIQVYPNPAVANTAVNLQINNLGGQQAVIAITDAGGKVVSRLSVQIGSDLTKLSLNTTQLPAGAYYITVMTANGGSPMTVPLAIIR